MKDTHWDPIFKQLAQLLSNRLLDVRYSRTNLLADLWGSSKLQKVQLEGDANPRNNYKLDANGGSRPCSKIHLFLKYFHENNNSCGGTESPCIVNWENASLVTNQRMPSCFIQPCIQREQKILEPCNCSIKSQNIIYHIAERHNQNFPVNLSQCYAADLSPNSLSNILPLIPAVYNPPILDLLQMTDYTKSSLWNVNRLINIHNDLNRQLLTFPNLQAFNNLFGISNNTLFSNNLKHREYQNLLNLVNILLFSKYQHLLTEPSHTTPYRNPQHINQLLQTINELSIKAADISFSRLNCPQDESSTILKRILSTPLKTFNLLNSRDNSNFEYNFPVYKPLTQINNFSSANNNLMGANHVPFFHHHPIHLQPQVVNVLYPNSTSVEQLNFLLKTVSPSDKRYCRLDMLFVQDEAKTRFMCKVSQYSIEEKRLYKVCMSAIHDFIDLSNQ
ncbi:unnamed protein product [Trichobilharzia szidati]|nr:unnamed protein product [Trichobilharzia szidati]